MSRGVNKVMLIGNTGSDPEIRMTPSGTKVAKFSLATNRKWKNPAGQVQDKTEWHRITMFGKLADIAEQYVTKGDRVYVEGRIEYDTTQGDDGVTRYWTDIIVNELVMLGAPEQKAAPREAKKEDKPDLRKKPEDDLPF